MNLSSLAFSGFRILGSRANPRSHRARGRSTALHEDPGSKPPGRTMVSFTVAQGSSSGKAVEVPMKHHKQELNDVLLD